MRKLLLFLVPLIAMAVAYSWWTGQTETTAEISAPTVDGGAENVSSDPATAATDETQAEAATEESEVSADSAASESQQSEAEAENAAADESPFTVVEQPADASGTEAAVEPSTGETQATAEAGVTADAADPAGQPMEAVVVPQSYPVTDAEKYFVPKDQRRPGNLGGPPPLDFPGGPSDPNRVQPGSDITAPAAPGQ